jgi:hypothetical protein
MRLFNYTRRHIDVTDILIDSGEAYKYSVKVMVVQFFPSVPCLANAYSRSEYMHMFQIRSLTKPTFVWCYLCGGMHVAVVNIGCMQESCRPVSSG